MIIGTGVDLLDIRRIQRLLIKFNSQFENRYFTQNEINFCQKRLKYVESLSKIFAIKEAVIKAVSNVKKVKSWHEIEIFHDENGKPVVKLYEQILKNVQLISNNFSINVSVSDEPPYIAAFVVISCIK